MTSNRALGLDLMLIVVGGGFIFASVGQSTPFCPGTPPWMARLAVFSLLAITARYWWLALTRGK